MIMRPGTSTVLRDAGSWVLGWVIIFKQAGIIFDPPSQVSDTLIWMAAGLIGVPGVFQLWQARSGAATSTAGPGQQPPSSESVSSSPGAS